MMKKQQTSDGNSVNKYTEVGNVENPQGKENQFSFTEMPNEANVASQAVKRRRRSDQQSSQASHDESDSRGQRSEAQSNHIPPQVKIDGELFYRVEGDLLLDSDQFDLYQEEQALQQAQREAFSQLQNGSFGEAMINQTIGQSGELVGILQQGKIVRWAPGTVLTYCVLRNTFPRDEEYQEVVENMQLATAAWEETCGIDFQYRPELDNSDTLRPEGVVFPVRYIVSGGAFIAAAFFPNDIPRRWRVLIDPSYFKTGFDHVGVLRHELGHVLGFRHEHIRDGAPRVCPDESTIETIGLTGYDPQSVMHYFCGGGGSPDLAITEVDRSGSQLVYGLPLSRFDLISV